MELNAIPAYDITENELTHCCPRFHPEAWDDQELHFEDFPFVRASTVNLFHIPLNMGSVFTKTLEAISDAHAETGSYLVLSHDDSAWRAEHLFAVDHDVPGAEMVHLTGDFLTKVFEGPFSNAKQWCAEMEDWVEGRGKKLDELYFFYTTCPRCAKVYGKNYVVGIGQVH